MSNYMAQGKFKGDNNYEEVEMLDDYFGKHRYGVRFKGGGVLRESLCDIISNTMNLVEEQVEDNKALKDDKKKPRLSIMPFKTVMEVAKVFEYGADKYSKHNFREGMEHTRYVDACFRHIHAWLSGEDIDESGLPHLDHAIASLMMMREQQLSNKGTDDRYYKIN